MAQYVPPPFSTDVPHPRTADDILVRTFFIQLFAAAAYYHLLVLLDFRKPHGAPLHPLLTLAFALFPELLLLQLGFWLLPALISSPWRRMIARRARELPFELGNGEAASPGRLLLHASFAVLSALPCAAVVGAYRQRLHMTWHAVTYVGNLGIDHRNGWAATGGLIASTMSVVVAGGLAVIVALREARKEDDDRERGGMGQITPNGARLWLVGGVGEIDWPALSEVVYTSLIHQLLLKLTNHVVPVMVLLRAWYLWPVLFWVVSYLYKKRGVRKEVLGLGAAVAFVAWTAGVQIIGDGAEFWNAAHGNVLPWNYRWQVKDRISAAIKKE